MNLAIGLRAQKGGAVVVGVAVDAAGPRVLLSTWLATAEPDDRLALEPYAIAFERAPDGRAEAAAAVVEGRGRQDHLAASGLAGIIAGFGRPAIAALLVNRAGWITDLLDYSLAWPDHVPVAEGLAVREAVRFGLAGNGVTTIELDEKSLADHAAATLALSGEAIDGELKALGASVGRPWRKEQKLACLAAWVAAADAR